MRILALAAVAVAAVGGLYLWRTQAPERAPRRATEAPPARVEPVAAPVYRGGCRVTGVVRGRDPLANVDVFAGRARFRTGAAGTFILDLRAGREYEVIAEPPQGSGLLPWRRVITTANAAEQTLAIVLEAGVPSRGRVLRSDGTPLAGVDVFALSEPVAAHEPARDLRGRNPPVATTDRDGTFRFRGLPAGRFHLAIGREEWIATDPVTMDARDQTVTLTATPCVTLDLYVRDLEGEHLPLMPFEATFAQKGAPARRFSASGYLVRRVRALPNVPFRLEVRAPGYHPEVVETPRARVVLWPDRPPNAYVTAAYDDGEPFDGALVASCRRSGVLKDIALEKVAPGEHRFYLVPGRWPSIEIGVRDTLFGEAASFRWVKLEETWARRIVIKRGGTVTLAMKRPAVHVVEHLRPGHSPTVNVSLPKTFHEVPAGRYRVLTRAGAVVVPPFDVTVGSRHTFEIE